MANLKNVSEAELKAELAQREREKEAGSRPKPKAQPDFSALTRMFESHLDRVESEGYTDEDFDHYVYEEVAKAIYGADFFKWLNKKVR